MALRYLTEPRYLTAPRGLAEQYRLAEQHRSAEQRSLPEQRRTEASKSATPNPALPSEYQLLSQREPLPVFKTPLASIQPESGLFSSRFWGWLGAAAPPPRQRVARFFSLVLCLGALSLSSLSHAETDAEAPSADASADAGIPSSLKSRPLAPLPEIPSQELAAPTPEQLEAVEAFLSRISSDDPSVREEARKQIPEVETKWVSALNHQLDKLAENNKNEDLRAALLKIRDLAREKLREDAKTSGKSSKVETPDYLEMLLSFAEPANKNWQAITQVMAISRLLREIGTTEAVRALIRVHIRFGEFLRVDTQLQLAELGDKALPALIETRRHQAPRISSWAERQLDALGKSIASEAVQTPDMDVLADILRAYGYTRDPDAARVVISFANSERPQVREAARQSVAMMKETANWPLRDTYSNIVGKRPASDWSWDRTARELFGEFDRLRLAQIYQLFDQGLAAEKAGKLTEAKAAFDKVLARNPLFERRSEMVDTYLAFAKERLDAEPEAAENALRRAQRLSKNGSSSPKVESLLWYLEGKELVSRGVADQVPFRRALELDPENQLAKDFLEEIQRGEQKQKKRSNNYLAAGAVGAVALLAIAIILIRRGAPVPNDEVPPSAMSGAPPPPKPDELTPHAAASQSPALTPTEPSAELAASQVAPAAEATPQPPNGAPLIAAPGPAALTEPAPIAPESQGQTITLPSLSDAASALSSPPIQIPDAPPNNISQQNIKPIQEAPQAGHTLPTSAPLSSQIQPASAKPALEAALEPSHAPPHETTQGSPPPSASAEAPSSPLPPIKPLELPPLPGLGGGSLQLPPLDDE